MRTRAGIQDRHRLKPGHTLIIKADAGGSGRAGELPAMVGASDSDTIGDKILVAPGKTVIIGPRAQVTRWLIESEGSGLDVEERTWVQNSEFASARHAEKSDHLPSLANGTVRVKSSHPDHEQGFYVINESDFDPKKHELWVDEAEAERAEALSILEVAEAKRAEARAASIKAAQPVETKSAGPVVLATRRDDRKRLNEIPDRNLE